MRAAGFRDVESTQERMPMCKWPEGWSTPPVRESTHADQSTEGTSPIDIRNRAIGQENAENVQELLYSLALYPMTHLQGYVLSVRIAGLSLIARARMPLEEFEALVEAARAEARDPSLKVSYSPISLSFES